MYDTDYSLFALEDFLADEFFRSSVRNPTTESIAFWREFVDSDPSNIGEYLVARRYIESSDDTLPFLSDEETARLWDNIVSATGLNRPEPLLKRRRLLYPAAAAAAVALLFFALGPVFRSAPASDISRYAHSAADTVGCNEARLIVSEQKTVVLGDQTAEITYDNSKITVSREEIPRTESARYNRLIIPKGRMSKLTLSDGTRVWVNADTRVVYPVAFTGKTREIYVDGEVFLDVTHDKRPFVVKTANLDVEVLGTRFNVCAYEDRSEQRIVLVEGSVKVVDAGSKEKTLLEPDQMYENSSGRVRVERVDVRNHASWIEGLYYFDRERLEIVARRLSDYYGVRIVCGEKAAGFVCSGKLDLKENLDDVLRGLCRTMPVTYRRIGDSIRLTTLETQP